MNGFDGMAAVKKALYRQVLGVTIVELLVVSVVIALLAGISFPILQLVKQREKEKRLKEILNKVRIRGIGLGAGDTHTHTIVGKGKGAPLDTFFGSKGYKNFMMRRIIQKAQNPKEYKDALFWAEEWGLLYPSNPNKLVFAVGDVVKVPAQSPPAGIFFDIEVDQRFISAVPPHPFQDWYPGSRWEFKVSSGGGGGWYSSESWPLPAVGSGVCDFRSVGAGIAINGENTDTWK